MTGLLKFIQEHIWHVAPILAVGAIGVAITIERTRALLIVYPMSNAGAFFETIRALLLADRVAEAVAFCDRYKSKPLVSVVREGLLRAHQPKSVIEHGLEIAVGEASDRIKARTGYLSTIANVATLLGLLGTILGLVQSFEAVGAASAQTRSAVLSAGISTAMNATMMGLAIAIPCMLAFSYLINRTNRMNAELGRTAVRTLDLLEQRYYGGASQKPEKVRSDIPTAMPIHIPAYAAGAAAGVEV